MNQSIAYDSRTDTFAITTRDRDGVHVELFTVPADAQTWIVAGVDCVALRDMVRRALAA